MGLLCRIIKWLYLTVTKLINSSLIDDPYGNQVIVEIANFSTILMWLFGFGGILYLLVKAISLKILLITFLLAYLAALGWSKFSRHLTAFEQEIYLIVSCVGLTVVIGTVIQLHRMQWANGKNLLVYWLFLLILGFIIWGITVFNVTQAAKFKPVLVTKKIESKQHFRTTKLPKEIPLNNPAQAYLKKLK